MLDTLVWVGEHQGDYTHVFGREAKAASLALKLSEPETSDHDANVGAYGSLYRSTQMWYCDKRDVPALIEAVSKEWVGHEIKVFNLAEIHQRGVGDLKQKKVTEDGVLP